MLTAWRALAGVVSQIPVRVEAFAYCSPRHCKAWRTGCLVVVLPDREDISDDSGFGGKHRLASRHDESNGFVFYFGKTGIQSQQLRATNNIEFLACSMANVQNLQSASVKVKLGTVDEVAGGLPAARQLVGSGEERILDSSSCPTDSGSLGRSNPISACLRQQSASARRPPPDPDPA